MNPLDPTTTAKLLALPSLREQAERDAEEFFSVPGWYTGTLWEDLTEDSREKCCDHMADLLSDFRRPMSQAWALREIGRLLGWDCGDRVPALERVENWTCAGYEVRDGANRWAPRISLAGMDRPAAIAAILLHLSDSGVSSVQ